MFELSYKFGKKNNYINSEFFGNQEAGNVVQCLFVISMMCKRIVCVKREFLILRNIRKKYLRLLKLVVLFFYHYFTCSRFFVDFI